MRLLSALPLVLSVLLVEASPAMPGGEAEVEVAVEEPSLLEPVVPFGPPPPASTNAIGWNIHYFGGTASVGGTLTGDEAPNEPLFGGLDEALTPYFEWKKALWNDHGLALGTDYTGHYFRGSEEVLGLGNTASSGDFRIYGNWTLTGRGHRGHGRDRLQVREPPQLQPAHHRPRLPDRLRRRARPAVQRRRVAALQPVLAAARERRAHRGRRGHRRPDRLPRHLRGSRTPGATSRTQVFLWGSGSIPLPNPGLGAAIGAMLTDQFYVIGGLADANGDPTSPWNSFNSFFSDREYFTQIEVGHTPSYEQRRTDNTHLTFWHTAARTAAGVPNGWGLNFSWSRKVNENLKPFVARRLRRTGAARCSTARSARASAARRSARATCSASDSTGAARRAWAASA